MHFIYCIFHEEMIDYILRQVIIKFCLFMFFDCNMMYRTKEVINDKMFEKEIANLKNLSPEVNSIAIQRQLYILL